MKEIYRGDTRLVISTSSAGHKIINAPLVTVCCDVTVRLRHIRRSQSQQLHMSKFCVRVHVGIRTE